MPADPILLLQMQRMGDLVLTYPLMLWLQKHHPGTPLWVVGEPMFYQSLLEISPHAFYLPWDKTRRLENRTFRKIINLSHRPEAASLAGRLDSPEKVGSVATESGSVYIRGSWQLYRASLVHNNRHNQFHWADLNALDVLRRSVIRATTWPEPKVLGDGRVGLFLGASQEEKRPAAAFWAQLADELAGRSLVPVLLGGPAEKALGKEVSALCKAPVTDLCGRFDLPGLVRALQELSLLVTPDTGPMHLASWMGVPCLNLSMGPVNPWETGPYQPGHHVLQAALSCVGCWQCTNPRPYRCRELFEPSRVAYLSRKLATGRSAELGRASLSGVNLFRTARNDIGLYHLEPLRDEGPTQRELTGRFWSRFFAFHFKSTGRPPMEKAWAELAGSAPTLPEYLLREAAAMASDLVRAGRNGRPLDENFWREYPPLMRPLSGYLQLFLQNHDFSKEGYRQALDCIEELSGFRG